MGIADIAVIARHRRHRAGWATQPVDYNAIRFRRSREIASDDGDVGDDGDLPMIR